MSAPPVAFLTGASSGIGHALGLEYARRGFDVVLLARRADRLQQLASEIEGMGRGALAVSGDVGVDGDLEKAVALAQERFGRIDVAIANAGISVAAPFERLSLDDYRRVFEINVFGVLRTAKACLPALQASRGSFAAVGSVNGFVALPGSSPYVSSKFAVRGLCESLRHDLRPSGVSVTHIAPGFVESEIRLVDNAGTLRQDREDPIPSWLVMPAEEAARQIVDAVAARRREAVITLHGKVAAAIARHAPGVTSGIIGLAGARARRDKS